MKKILLAVITVFMAGFCFAGQTHDENIVVNNDVLVCVDNNEGVTPETNTVMLPGPQFDFKVHVVLGKKPDCRRWWPICELIINDIPLVKSENNIDATLVVSDNEMCIVFNAKDLNNSTNVEIKKNLLNTNKVVFGQDIDIPDEIIEKCGMKINTKIDGSLSYKITAEKEIITVHIPR